MIRILVERSSVIFTQFPKALACSHLKRACECLWELGKDDARALNQNPDHAIRILSELCSVEPNKPIGYNEIVVDFSLSLIAKDNAWDHSYTPLDVLKDFLE